MFIIEVYDAGNRKIAREIPRECSDRPSAAEQEAEL